MKLVKPLLAMSLVVLNLGCAYLPDLMGDSSTDKVPSESTKREQKSEGDKSVPVRDVQEIAKRDDKSSVDKMSYKRGKKLPKVVDLATGKIVFLRASFVASAVDARIYDVTSGAPKFVAEVKNNTQIHHTVDAGNYTYMLASDNSVDYMNVHVAPNLRYYSVVKPSMGAWKPSFAFQPVKSRDNNAVVETQDVIFFGDEKVEALFSAMTPVVEVRKTSSKRKTPKAIMKIHLDHWQDWKNETPDLHAAKTLNSLDGR